jgi:hypothetical protein
MFTGFDGTPQTYMVSAAFSRNTAYFLGREFFVGVFDFIDFDRAMLTSDSLPTDTLFAPEADKYHSTAESFVARGLLTKAQKNATVSKAKASTCGHKK